MWAPCVLWLLRTKCPIEKCISLSNSSAAPWLVTNAARICGVPLQAGGFPESEQGTWHSSLKTYDCHWQCGLQISINECVWICTMHQGLHLAFYILLHPFIYISFTIGIWSFYLHPPPDPWSLAWAALSWAGLTWARLLELQPPVASTKH